MFADLSKNLANAHTRQLLTRLARSPVEAYRDAMFAGEPINNTENRAVMHRSLRSPDKGEAGYREPVNSFVAQSLADVPRSMPCWQLPSRCGRMAITDIVSIGIGGSDLRSRDGGKGCWKISRIRTRSCISSRM